MRHFFPTFAITPTLLLLLTVGGLWLVHWRHEYAPKTYLVVDADSLQPISMVEISIPTPVLLIVPMFLNHFQPEGDAGRTNKKGLVTLRVAKDLDGSAWVTPPNGYTLADSPAQALDVTPRADKVFFLRRTN